MPDFIDFSPWNNAKSNFEKAPDLCNLFKLLAVETWKRIEFTYNKPYLRIYETTLTQNIAFAINAYAQQYPKLLIEVWESINEFATGNDLELLVVFPKFAITFYAPIQSKKIYRRKKYNAMDHGDQIDKLIDYAKKSNGCPLYLLYNFVEQVPYGLRADKEFYGCTLIDAHHLHKHHYNQRTKWRRDGTTVKAWNIPSFNSLHPKYAFPWHELVCGSNHPSSLLQKVLTITNKDSKSQYGIIPSEAELQTNLLQYPGFVRREQVSFVGWFRSKDREIGRGPRMDYDREYLDMQDEGPAASTEFNPRTRIVVTIGN
jgi:hypothetical protein